VRLHAAVPRPPKFLAIGLNYRDHAAEAKLEIPKLPIVFNKQTSCVAGPHDPIWLPRVSRALDYEAELGFVIGRRCRHVPRERAHEVIAGYLVANDVSVRDWQLRTPTMTMGKSFDTHGPLGPWLVTPGRWCSPSWDCTWPSASCTSGSHPAGAWRRTSWPTCWPSSSSGSWSWRGCL
jgi:2-keto-4-pentenoate hydratase/2-oxohepta-3-ene-1,7-dioic acid hydratase in catechol pathway